MKVLDPQAALLTNAEVYHFLETNPPRKPDKKSGAYEAVDLPNLAEIRKDFKRYIDLTSPHIKQYPPPDQFIENVVQRLRKYDLTKTEALTFINLGLGLSRSQPANAPIETSGHVQGEAEIEKAHRDGDFAREAKVPTSEKMMAPGDEAGAIEPNFRALADCVIESIGERFLGDECEQKIKEILSVLQESADEVKNG